MTLQLKDKNISNIPHYYPLCCSISRKKKKERKRCAPVRGNIAVLCKKKSSGWTARIIIQRAQNCTGMRRDNYRKWYLSTCFSGYRQIAVKRSKRDTSTEKQAGLSIRARRAPRAYVHIHTRARVMGLKPIFRLALAQSTHTRSRLCHPLKASRGHRAASMRAAANDRRGNSRLMALRRRGKAMHRVHVRTYNVRVTYRTDDDVPV